MANWFTRGISRVNNAVRTGLQRAFGGTQPTVQPPARDIRFPEPEEPPFIPLGGQLAPTPADYGEDEIYGEEEEPVYEQEPLPGLEEEYPDEVTLYDDYFQAVETDRLMTANDWLKEAQTNRGQALYDKYGVDNLDMIRQLKDQGYDYTFIKFDKRKGVYREYSGLWRDWREAYEQAFG